MMASGASIEVGYRERKRERQHRFMEGKGGIVGSALPSAGEWSESRVGASRSGDGRRHRRLQFPEENDDQRDGPDGPRCILGQHEGGRVVNDANGPDKQDE
jgi:hypothetical protein